MKPNIDAKGRQVRAAMGIFCLAAAAGVFIASRSKIVTGVLVVAGLFMLFEASKSWCALRACGIRTKV